MAARHERLPVWVGATPCLPQFPAGPAQMQLLAPSPGQPRSALDSAGQRSHSGSEGVQARSRTLLFNRGPWGHPPDWSAPALRGYQAGHPGLLKHTAPADREQHFHLQGQCPEWQHPGERRHLETTHSPTRLTAVADSQVDTWRLSAKLRETATETRAQKSKVQFLRAPGPGAVEGAGPSSRRAGGERPAQARHLSQSLTAGAPHCRTLGSVSRVRVCPTAS